VWGTKRFNSLSPGSATITPYPAAPIYPHPHPQASESAGSELQHQLGPDHRAESEPGRPGSRRPLGCPSPCDSEATRKRLGSDSEATQKSTSEACQIGLAGGRGGGGIGSGRGLLAQMGRHWKTRKRDPRTTKGAGGQARADPGPGSDCESTGISRTAGCSCLRLRPRCSNPPILLSLLQSLVF
jgi:hypothetical protein